MQISTLTDRQYGSLPSTFGSTTPATSSIKQIVFLAGLALLALHIMVSVCAAQNGEAEDQGGRLPVGTWIQGEPLRFDGSDGKKLYVLVFWATWCDACKASFVELSSWNASHEGDGVGIVALSSEQEKTVRDFVAKQQQSMNFRVAIDLNGTLANRFQITQIPKVVILDTKGQVLITSSMTSRIENILARVGQPDFVDGVIKEELVRAKQMERAESLLPIYSAIAMSTKEKELLESVHAKIMEYGGDNPETLGLLTKEVLEIKEERVEVSMLEQIRNDALVAAERANSLRGGKDPKCLAGLAAIKYRLGQRQEAISHLRAAVALSKDDEEERQSLISTLREYVVEENAQVRWHLEHLNGKNAITITLGGDTALDLEATTVRVANGSGAPLDIIQPPVGHKQSDGTGNEKLVLDGKETYTWYLSGRPEDGPFTIDLTYRTCQRGGKTCGMPQPLYRIVDLNADQPKGGVDTALAHYRGGPVFLGPAAPLLLETRPEESKVDPELLAKEVAKGANFFNHYRLLAVDCGEGCLETVVVDLYAGTIASTKVDAKGLAFSPDSEILVQYSARPLEEPEATLKTRYAIWGLGEFQEMEDFGKN